jgi:hypothetical protein
MSLRPEFFVAPETGTTPSSGPPGRTRKRVIARKAYLPE